MSELWKLSAAETAAKVRSREVSAVEVTQSALARLAAVNPKINAVVDEMPEEALAAARAVDAALDQGVDAGPLAGVPVTIKVLTDQTGFATTNGLKIQKDLIAERDSPVVANLRAAGAVIIGRTNTPAFSLRWFTRNGVHGWTKNPHNPALTPGGSSGGAGAATAAGIGAMGHGTDIAGSIRYPAYACGIHGLRPSLGRIPATNFTGGDRFIGPQLMAVSGPLARTVEDLRLTFHAMAAASEEDPWYMPVPLALDAPRTAALCVNPEGMETASEIETALRRAAQTLERAGWRVVETETPPIDEPMRLQLTLWLAEFRRSSEAALKAENDADALHVYEQLSKIPLESGFEAVFDALQRRAGLVREWQRFFAQHSILLCPVSGELPFRDQEDVESAEAFARIARAQRVQIGSPFMSLPGLALSTGMVDGPLGRSPVGVQIIGGRYHEEIMLRAAEIIEADSPPPPIAEPTG